MTEKSPQFKRKTTRTAEDVGKQLGNCEETGEGDVSRETGRDEMTDDGGGGTERGGDETGGSGHGRPAQPKHVA